MSARLVGRKVDLQAARRRSHGRRQDKKIILSSECGVLPHIDQSTIVKKGRLSPGKMLWADFAEGRLMSDAEVKQQLAVSQPWGKWMSEKSVSMPELVKSLSKERTHMRGHDALSHDDGSTQQSPAVD